MTLQADLGQYFAISAVVTIGMNQNAGYKPQWVSKYSLAYMRGGSFKSVQYSPRYPKRKVRNGGESRKGKIDWDRGEKGKGR